MKFLITGGAGFIGSNFLHYVTNKYQNDMFVCFDALTYAGDYNNIKELENKKNFKFIEGDIVNKEFVDYIFKTEKFDIVINFAAETHVDNSIKNPEVFINTNIIGTQNLLNCSKKYNIKRYHQISTDEVYGDLGFDNLDEKFDENSTIKPSNPYSASKASADLLVMSYYKTFNLPVTISRCSNNYGPYQHTEKLIPLIISKALKNENIPIHGNGKNIRDWIHVKDHNIAIDMIVRKGKIGQIYNVGASGEKSNLEVVKTILKVMNKSENLIVFVSDRPSNDLRYAMNSNKLQKELGWKPTYNFDDGIKETIEWYKNKQDI